MELHPELRQARDVDIGQIANEERIRSVAAIQPVTDGS